MFFLPLKSLADVQEYDVISLKMYVYVVKFHLTNVF